MIKLMIRIRPLTLIATQMTAIVRKRQDSSFCYNFSDRKNGWDQSQKQKWQSALLTQKERKQAFERLLKNQQNVKEIDKRLKKIEQEMGDLHQKINEQKQKQQKLSNAPIGRTFDLSQQLASQLAPKISLTLNPSTHSITLDTYQQLLESVFLLINEKNRQLTQKARQERRQAYKNGDLNLYMKILRQFVFDLDHIIKEGECMIVRKMGMSDQEFLRGKALLLEDQRGKVIIARNNLRIKLRLPATKPHNLAKTKQILKQLSQLAEQKSPQITELLKTIPITAQPQSQSLKQLSLLFSYILSDHIHSKHGYQEEDYMEILSTKKEIVEIDKEVREILEKMKRDFIEVAVNLGVLPNTILGRRG